MTNGDQLDRLLELRRLTEGARRREDQRLGALAEVRRALQSEFGVKSETQLSKLILDEERAVAELERQLELELEQAEREWSSGHSQ